MRLFDWSSPSAIMPRRDRLRALSSPKTPTRPSLCRSGSFALAAAFGEKTGRASAANRFVPPAPDSWQKLSDAQRAVALQAMIDGHPAGRGVHVNQVEGGHRAVVSFEIELDSAGKQGRLAQLETWLKEEIDNSFQLLLAAKKDQNIARTKGATAK